MRIDYTFNSGLAGCFSLCWLLLFGRSCCFSGHRWLRILNRLGPNSIWVVPIYIVGFKGQIIFQIVRFKPCESPLKTCGLSCQMGNQRSSGNMSKLRLTIDLFQIFCETSQVCLLNVRISLAEISSFWPDIVAVSRSVEAQVLHRVHRTLRQQYPHCSKDVDPP